MGVFPDSSHPTGNETELRTPWTVRVGALLFRYRYIPYPFLGLFTLFCRVNECEDGMFVAIPGVSLMILGSLLRIYSIRYIGGAARTRKRKAKKLICSGPFCYVRNPIYIANILVMSGFVWLCELLWFAPIVAVGLWGFYHMIVLFEEDILKEKFLEDYAGYETRVPRWIPQLRPAYYSGQNPVFPWSNVLRRERTSVFNMVIMIAAVFMKESLLG
ncbi:MAG: isoprenylcysteine carboxylmethyltransferase family protein [bacterium]